MIWADKAALFFAILVAVAAAAFWTIAAVGLGTASTEGLTQNTLLWVVEAELGITLPLWLGLRAVNFLFGPSRRSSPAPEQDENPGADTEAASRPSG